MARILVQAADFDIGAEFAALAIADPTYQTGGVGCFIGRVRAAAAGRPIVAMTLEHYPAMTERALLTIATEAERRWQLQGCTLIHRVGRLQRGENIVLVLASSAHRQSALAATSFLIDWLKTRAPFWKKEHFADGGGTWVEAKVEDETATSGWTGKSV